MSQKTNRARHYDIKLRDQINYMNNQKLYKLQLNESKLAQKIMAFSKPYSIPKVYKPTIDLFTVANQVPQPRIQKLNKYLRNIQPQTERHIKQQERSYFDQYENSISKIKESKQEANKLGKESSKNDKLQIKVYSQMPTAQNSPKQEFQSTFSRKVSPRQNQIVKRPKRFIFRDFRPRETPLPSSRLFQKATQISGYQKPNISQKTLEIISQDNQKLLQDVLNQSAIEDQLYRHGNYNRILKIVRQKELETKKQLKLMKKAFAQQNSSNQRKEL